MARHARRRVCRADPAPSRCVRHTRRGARSRGEGPGDDRALRSPALESDLPGAGALGDHVRMTWSAPEIERRAEPYVADERAMLQGWLNWQRDTLLHKCAGLTAE